MSVLGASLMVTAIAVAGGFGFLPSGPDRSDASASVAGTRPGSGSSVTETASARPSDSSTHLVDEARAPVKAATGITDRTLPPRSGTGRRAVFSEERQHVWIVDGEGTVVRHYPVSGSVYDNLEPGTYAVYSRSRNAVGIDDSGTMEYFVRFTQGTGGSAIGFHSIPVDDGAPLQTIAQLGTPLSHGCIRQKRADAIAMWEFAHEGTKVVVTA